MQKNLKFLGALFTLLLIISYFVLQYNKQDYKNETEFLIPELKTQINDIDSIVIRKNEKIISLSKKSGVWLVLEADNYLADANIIANLLLDLRKFKLKEKKTAKPENYFKLSLDEKGENAATGLKLWSAQRAFADVFIGKKAQNSQGFYVRKNNQQQSWLAEGTINIKLNPNDWILTTILDIASNQIKSVSFVSDGQEFTLDKITPQDTNFVLINMPEKSQLKTGINLTEFANGLQKFSIESAKPRSSFAEEPLLTVSYQLFSGMKYHLEVSTEDQSYFMHINLENADYATENDRQLENWTYEIARYKFDALNKKLTDIIEPKEPKSTIGGEDD